MPLSCVAWPACQDDLKFRDDLDTESDGPMETQIDADADADMDADSDVDTDTDSDTDAGGELL